MEIVAIKKHYMTENMAFAPLLKILCTGLEGFVFYAKICEKLKQVVSYTGCLKHICLVFKNISTIFVFIHFCDIPFLRLLIASHSFIA